MKLRVLGLVAVMALVPVSVRAQVPPCCTPLNKTLVSKMIPLLQGESMSSNDLNTRLAARGMTKQEYVALKNSLFAAKLDAADASRLRALPFDDGSRATRQANVAVYQANAAVLNAALTKVHADGGCGAPCSATPPATGQARKR